MPNTQKMSKYIRSAKWLIKAYGFLAFLQSFYSFFLFSYLKYVSLALSSIALYTSLFGFTVMKVINVSTFGFKSYGVKSNDSNFKKFSVRVLK